MKKRAFTLIELLVVIAIIAILAAILFPVFASAKTAAKGAASLSNTKQQALAALMYATDVDDYFMPACRWNSGSDPLTFGTGLSFSTWAYLIQPYMKNGELFQDPLARSISNSWPRAVLLSFQPTYGYNYTALAPYQGGSPGTANCKQQPISGTSPENPADTVLLSSKFSILETRFGLTTGVGFAFTPWMDNGPNLNTTVEAPDCWNIVPWCAANWGRGSQMETFYGLTNANGANTGGVSFRASENSVVAFTDGHAKKFKKGNLAAGTNWTETLLEPNLVVNNRAAYMWDIL